MKYTQSHTKRTPLQLHKIATRMDVDPFDPKHIQIEASLLRAAYRGERSWDFSVAQYDLKHLENIGYIQSLRDAKFNVSYVPDLGNIYTTIIISWL